MNLGGVLHTEDSLGHVQWVHSALRGLGIFKVH